MTGIAISPSDGATCVVPCSKSCTILIGCESGQVLEYNCSGLCVGMIHACEGPVRGIFVNNASSSLIVVNHHAAAVKVSLQ